MDFMKQDKLTAIANAKELLLQNPVIFDTETTGWDDRAEIVEIAIVDANGEVLLDSLVQPVGTVPSDSTAVHGLEARDLVDAPTIDDLMPQIGELFNGRLVMAYNLDYDWRLLQQSLYVLRDTWLLDFRDEVDPKRLSCIKRLYARFFGDWSDYHQSYTWQSLPNAMAQCRLALEGSAHRALSDAKSALAMLKHIAGSQ